MQLRPNCQAIGSLDSLKTYKMKKHSQGYASKSAGLTALAQVNYVKTAPLPKYQTYSKFFLSIFIN